MARLDGWLGRRRTREFCAQGMFIFWSFGLFFFYHQCALSATAQRIPGPLRMFIKMSGFESIEIFHSGSNADYVPPSRL